MHSRAKPPEIEMCEVCGGPGAPRLCPGLTNTIKDSKKKIGISILQKVVDVHAAAAAAPTGVIKKMLHSRAFCAFCFTVRAVVSRFRPSFFFLIALAPGRRPVGPAWAM